MSEMVELVARAICQIHCGDGAGWRAFVQDARAAIDAMREPTAAMTGNAKRLMDHPRFNHYDAAFVWRAMVDAALVSERGYCA